MKAPIKTTPFLSTSSSPTSHFYSWPFPTVPSVTEEIERGGGYGFSLQILSPHAFPLLQRGLSMGCSSFRKYPPAPAWDPPWAAAETPAVAPKWLLCLLLLLLQCVCWRCPQPFFCQHLGHFQPIHKQSMWIRVSALCQVDIFFKAAGPASGWTHFLAKAEVSNSKNFVSIWANIPCMRLKISCVVYAHRFPVLCSNWLTK